METSGIRTPKQFLPSKVPENHGMTYTARWVFFHSMKTLKIFSRTEYYCWLGWRKDSCRCVRKFLRKMAKAGKITNLLTHRRRVKIVILSFSFKGTKYGKLNQLDRNLIDLYQVKTFFRLNFEILYMFKFYTNNDLLFNLESSNQWL